MATPAPTHYRAFISYAHADGRAARRLHRRLEAWRPPRGLSRDAAYAARLPSGRLRPIFRDRDELASSASLGDLIQQALDASEALIVVCSPAAVRSRWVNEEIRWFRTHHPERPVLAFVAGGDPGADPRAEPQRAAFPLNLLLADVAYPDGPYGEPLAADARREGDGFAMAFLKLAAGLLGVPFDRLRQREARRRQRNLALIAGASVALSTVFAFMAWRATVARNEARVARAQAELELVSERETRAFLLSVFELADPSEARGRSVTVREVLDRAVARIDSTAFSRPVIRARFLATMGQAYSRLGLNRRGAELLLSSLDALPADSLAPEDLGQAVDSRIELADVRFDMGDYDAALEAIAPLGPAADLSPLRRARAANLRGDVLAYTDRPAEARAAYEEALALLDRAAASREEDASARARSLGGMALLSHFSGNAGEAQRLYGDAVAILVPVFGESHPDTIWAMLSWGSAAYSSGDTATAEAAWQRVLRTAREVLGDTNPEVATIKNNLGRLLLETGRYAEAEALLRDALAIDRQHRVEDFDDLAFTLHNLALTRSAQGDATEAQALLVEARDIAAQSGHRMLGPVLVALADLACSAGLGAEGLELAQQALPDIESHHGTGDWRYDQALLVAAFCAARSGAAIDRSAGFEARRRLLAHWPHDGYFRQQTLRIASALYSGSYLGSE